MTTYRNGHYYNADGEIISELDIQEISNELLELYQRKIDDASRLFSADNITRREYRKRLRRLYSDLGTTQYMLGRGGRNQMVLRDWVSVAKFKASQVKYLNRFMRDIKKLSPAQILHRGKLYMKSASHMYVRGQALSKITEGHTECRWILDDSADNCSRCPYYARLGWQKIRPWPFKSNGGANVYPGSGHTPCGVYCHCYLEYK